MSESEKKRYGLVAGFVLFFTALAFFSSLFGYGIDILGFLPIPADWMPMIMGIVMIISAWSLGVFKRIKEIWD